MRGERPDAPRCPVCGKFMEVVKQANSTVSYECCGVQKTKVSPSETFSMYERSR